ncbi:MAG: hypothetical protein IJV00_08845 [Clostridia bacterium]|nr:hypothetical protein [Clostridia bacterium]
MKSIEEYTLELEKRIAEKKSARKKMTHLAAILCAALALGVGAAFLPGLINKTSDPSLSREKTDTVSGAGMTFPLAADTKDRFVLNDAEYNYSENDHKTEDRIGLRGLNVFSDSDALFFSLSEWGPVYRIAENGISHVPGRFPLGVYYGAAYRDGWIYMPATREIVCGLVRSNGICRYGIASQVTQSVIASDGMTASVVISGNDMFYASVSWKEELVEIKKCDLETGEIFLLARISAAEPRSECVRIALCTDRLAVRIDEKVYTVACNGDVKQISDCARAGIGTDGDKIFVFDSEGEPRPEFFETRKAALTGAEIYSAATGEKLGGYKNDSDELFPIVFDGGLAALRDGKLLLVDPFVGSERELGGVFSDRCYAALAGDKLLVVDPSGYVDGNLAGDVYLFGADGLTFKGELCSDIIFYREETLRFTGVDEAMDTLLFAPTDLPVDTALLELKDVYGGAAVRGTTYGKEREINRGYLYINAAFNGKNLYIAVSQDQSVTWQSFSGKLGYGDWLERKLFGAEEYPVKDNGGFDELGDQYYDLLSKDGEPCGMMTWLDTGADEVFSEIRVFYENSGFTALVSVTSSELTLSELQSILTVIPESLA